MPEPVRPSGLRSPRSKSLDDLLVIGVIVIIGLLFYACAMDTRAHHQWIEKCYDSGGEIRSNGTVTELCVTDDGIVSRWR